MEDIIFFIGIMGNITSMMVFLSPIGTFRRIVKQQSTEEFESLPYICALLSASLWTFYGLVKPGAFPVATVNGFGTIVELIYVGIFLAFAPPKLKAKTAVLMGIFNVGFLGAAILVPRLVLEGEARLYAMGFLCAAISCIMYGSPLAAMRTVVRTRSVEYMPFLLSFFIFLGGGTWAVYGWLIRDCFIWVPNGTGFLLGSAQILLYAIYRYSPKSAAKIGTWPSAAVDGSEEGWQHQPLLV